MKILVISQRFWPENFRINDAVGELVKMGHDVTVLTGLPNYPKGDIFSGYERKENWKQRYNGATILRVKEHPRKTGPLHRFWNYWSFAHNGNNYINKLDKDYDVIFLNGLSPIHMSEPAIKYKKKYGTKIVMYLMDIWPDSLIAGGIREGNPIFNFYKKKSQKIYNNMDTILVSSRPFIEHLRNNLRIDKPEIIYLPQYAETIFEENSVPLKESEDKIFVFAGNIGKAQSVDTIIRAASLIKETNAKIKIAGNGSEFNKIKKLASELNCSNVEFLGQLPLDEMPKLYSMASAMLVTLESNSFADKTLPGKVQTYMAMGKPIVASANGATREIIEESCAGVCCSSGDYKELAKIILEFDKTKYKNIREYYFDNFSRKRYFYILSNILEDSKKGR